MGVLSRLLGNEKTIERRGNDAAILAALVAGDSASSGVSVTPENSLAYSAVLACVRVLAEGVAQLPLILYERQERGRQRAVDHPLYAVLHTQPNPEITSFEWRELLMAHLTLWGNGFCEIERDGAGRPLALWPLMPWSMTVYERPSGERWYEYELDGGKKQVLRGDQVLHVPGFGYDGLTGKSLIRLARESVGLGMAAQRYGATVFGNGEVPGGVLEHPGTLTDGAFERLKKSWSEQHQGLANANRLAILEEGMKYNKVGIPPEDAQFLETRKFQRTEIAAIFRVPPHMIGDLERATFSNIEQQSLDFVIYTLQPWLVRIEQRLAMHLLSQAEQGRYYAEHLVAGLLRGDIASRYQAYSVGRQWGWLSANDVRELENMNPVEAGDAYLQPMNMIEAGAQPEQQPPAGSDQAPMDGGSQQEEQPADGSQDANRSLEGRTDRAQAGWEQRSAAGRRRVVEVGRGALEDAAQRVVNRETNDIGNAARRMLRSQAPGQAETRSAEQFVEWLRRFLEEHQGFVYERLWASWWAMAQLVADAAMREVVDAGLDEVDASRNVEAFSKGMLRGRSIQWTERLRIRLEDAVAAAEEAGDDPLAAVEDVLDQRKANEAGSWSRDLGTAVGNAVAVTVFTVAGVELLRWVSLGTESCPYCEQLNGSVVGTGKIFVSSADGVEVDGHERMSPGSDVSHPPLHQGCSCVIVVEK